MKLTSQTIACGLAGDFGGQPARVEPFVRAHARVGGEARVELAAGRRRPRRPSARRAPSSTSVKPPVEAPTSRQARPVGSSAEGVERRGELDAAARDPGMRRAGLDPRVFGERRRRPCARVSPSALTSPAAIAACARARLAKNPRSTRRRSARLRMRGWRREGPFPCAGRARFGSCAGPFSRARGEGSALRLSALARVDEQARVEEQQAAVGIGVIGVGEVALVALEELRPLARVERIEERPQRAAAEPVDHLVDAAQADGRRSSPRCRADRKGASASCNSRCGCR